MAEPRPTKHISSPTRRGLLLSTLSLLMSRTVAARPQPEPLFHIARSKNRNIVQYDAIRSSSETLDPQHPVVVYWVLLAEDGRREELSFLDRRAYGFKVVREVGATSWLLYLAAAEDRALRVVYWQGRWVAQIVIRGRSAVLKTIYVSADDSKLIPTVHYVDLYGFDMVTNQPLTERLRP